MCRRTRNSTADSHRFHQNGWRNESRRKIRWLFRWGQHASSQLRTNTRTVSHLDTRRSALTAIMRNMTAESDSSTSIRTAVPADRPLRQKTPTEQTYRYSASVSGQTTVQLPSAPGLLSQIAPIHLPSCIHADSLAAVRHARWR